MKKKLVASFLAVLLIVALCLTGCGKSTEQLVDEARSGVVRILVTDREGNSRFVSGFGVGEAREPTRWFVTTGLPLDDLGEDISVWIVEDDIAFSNGTADTSSVIPCKIKIQSVVTVIVAEREPEGRTALQLCLSDPAADSGQKIFALGYAPAEEPAGTIPASVEACSITESMVKRRTKSGAFDGLKVIQHSGDFFSSLAGGPLIDEKGEVVGVLMAASDEPNGCVSLDVQYVKEILEETDMLYYGEKETSPALIGGIAVLTLTVAAAILFCFRKKFRKRQEKAQAPKPDPPPTRVPLPRPDPEKYMIRYMLVCLGGRYEGKRFYLRDHVKIGRDRQWSHLVYSKDELASIGGRHCILVSDNTQLWMKNCTTNTTLYGPSLEERRMLKIDETVELHPGDMIWLGNGKNWFVIESNPLYEGPII